jgi:hypothetical protein
MVGKGLRELDLSCTAAPSLDALYRAVAERAATLPADAWVMGAGYDQNIGAHPTARRSTEPPRAVRSGWCTVGVLGCAGGGLAVVAPGGVVVGGERGLGCDFEVADFRDAVDGGADAGGGGDREGGDERAGGGCPADDEE